MPIHDHIANLLGPWSWGLGIGSILLRLALSALLATAVGWERSSKRHSAGLRTFILITVGSTAEENIVIQRYLYRFHQQKTLSINSTNSRYANVSLRSESASATAL